MIFFLMPAFYVTDKGLVCCVDRYRYTILYIDGRYIVLTLKNSSID